MGERSTLPSPLILTFLFLSPLKVHPSASSSPPRPTSGHRVDSLRCPAFVRFYQLLPSLSARCSQIPTRMILSSQKLLTCTRPIGPGMKRLHGNGRESSQSSCWGRRRLTGQCSTHAVHMCSAADGVSAIAQHMADLTRTKNGCKSTNAFRHGSNDSNGRNGRRRFRVLAFQQHDLG